MADNVIANPGSGGATFASDEIGGIHYPRTKMTFGADGVATDVSLANPLPVDFASLTSPQVTTASAASLAAGGSTDLDSTQITSSTTGRLIQLVMSSSVAVKWILKTVLNAAETDRVVFFTQPGETKIWPTPSPAFITQAESATAGFDGFRLTATNLDTSEAADVYTTFFYDEV